MPKATAEEESTAADQDDKPGTQESGTHEIYDWDTTMLTRMVGDNPDLHRRLMEQFLVTAQEQMVAILAAAAALDAATVGNVAHSLKSAARTVGAMQLGELCHAMEQAGKAGDAQACNVLAKRLNVAFEAAETAILNQLMG